MNSNANEYNREAMAALWKGLQTRADVIKKGGGEKAIKKQHERNKLTPRERIRMLCDQGSTFMELGLFAAYGMYEEEGGCPAAGTVSGLGKINGRLCMILANDQTVKAGAWFPMTGKKNLRMQEIAMENHLPVVYLVDSAGVFLPMQEGIFPDKEHFGRIFRNNARMSAMGISQIAAVMGPCVAGGAYLPIMSDETLMVKGNGSIFLAGPYLVKAAIGEDVDAETLGGSHTHTAISGIADYEYDTEQECIKAIRDIVGRMAPPKTAGFNRTASLPPAMKQEKISGYFPAGNLKPYDVRNLLKGIVDADSMQPFKDEYGETIFCAYARVEGWSVGIVANQRLVGKNARGEMQMGGVIYNDSADKAARFIQNCNQKKIPLVFLQDVTGFMVGSRSEHSGIIKDGAKMVNAVANSVVPKITIITGNSYGAGNYAMCGKAYDPRFIFAWPTAQIAVMGGAQAARTLLQIQVAGMKSRGEAPDEQQEQELLKKITRRYAEQTEPLYAAAHLWVDEIIHPADTRKYIALCLEAADQNPEMPDWKSGVFQV